MENVRKFEKTKLTNTIILAIAAALEHIKDCGLKEELIALYDKIEEEKLDVRFVSREY